MHKLIKAFLDFITFREYDITQIVEYNGLVLAKYQKKKWMSAQQFAKYRFKLRKYSVEV